MHLKIYKEFERICAPRDIRGSVLEVGAMPDDSSLLNMVSLENAKEKIGINLNGPYDFNCFNILKGDANDMTCFSDNRFDVVLCNAVLEHDKFFWKTISEIKRVTKHGGLIVIGTPGYGILSCEKYFHKISRNIPFLSRLLSKSFLSSSTLTLQVHNYPGDYYRFSEQTFKEVFFAGMKEVVIRSIMIPPRIIGAGLKE